MRIDKYLKVSRLIKRRTVAAAACDGGKVLINGKIAKPSSVVKVGDVLELHLGANVNRFEILIVAENVRAAEAVNMYKAL